MEVVYDELLDCFKLKDEELSTAITDLHLQKISTDIISEDWGMLNPHLDMADIAVSDARTAYQNATDQRLEYLKKWKREKGSDATYKKMIVACLNISNKSYAEAICALFMKTHEISGNTGTVILVHSLLVVKILACGFVYNYCYRLLPLPFLFRVQIVSQVLSGRYF